MAMLKFAIVGCGRIAHKHFEALQGHPHARIEAVCDSASDRAEKAGRSLGVPYYSDMEEMVRGLREKLDVATILTPSGLHAEHCIRLSKHFKNIIVEKPISLTVDDSNKMIEACLANQCRLFIVKQNRYNLPVVKLKQALDQGRFGKLVMGTVRVRWTRDQAYYDQDKWRGTWSMDGGVFANQASHHIDLLCWLMGKVESVVARTHHALADIETEDTGAAILKFRNGAIGIVEATTATRPSDLEGSLSILGERGSVEIGGFAVNLVKTWSFSSSVPEDEMIRMGFNENPTNVYGFGHKRFIDEVIDSIIHDKPAPVDGADARRSLEVIEAIYESAATGAEVRVGTQPVHSRLGRK